MHVSAVNMFKSRCFALVLAVICPPTLEEVANIVNVTASNQQQNAIVITVQVAGGGETNGTRLEDVVNEIKDLKKLIAPALTEGDAAEPSKQALVSALVSNCVPLLIQQNVNGSNFFNRSWAEFKVGFNDSRGNYWLGNELLNQLTLTGRYKLKFDLQSRSNNNWYYAEYSTFIVLSEADNYRLHVAGYSGNAGNAFNPYHDGMMFTTYDRDNDLQSYSNCAVRAGGGFWYKNCYNCGVNSAHSSSSDWGFYWYGLPGHAALQSSRMWLQCR